MELNVNVRISLDATPGLTSLVAALMGGRQTAAPEVTDATQLPGKPAAEKPAKRGKTKQAPEPETVAAPAPEEVQEAAPEPAQESAPAPEAGKTEVKEYTEEDVRAAMHRTRQRIEGENYKENTDSPGYQKYHKQLTSQFKNIASLFGAEKPSALPDSDSRKKFIDECNKLGICEDGNIGVTDAPF